MKKITTLLLMFFAFGVTSVMAQGRTISGKVTDAATNEPVVGATVMVQGTDNGAYSMEGGEFVIPNVQGAVNLEVTFIGYKDAIIAVVASETNVNIKLKTSADQLDGVIIVAYGVADPKSLTGSVAVISSEQIEDRPVTNVLSAIAGSAPGIQTTTPTGRPGSSPAIRIRGIGSISASSEPLYVVDGVPYIGDIGAIPTEDIASMSILKDASSTSLYGSKGSNGVILIQTKSGRKERISFNVKIEQGFQYTSMPDYDIVGAMDYYELGVESAKQFFMGNGWPELDALNRITSDITDPGGMNWYNLLKDNKTGLQMKPSSIYGLPYMYDDPNNKEGWHNVSLNPNASLFEGYDDLDWNNHFTDGIGYRQNYNISASGGTEKASYYTSIGYTQEDGYFKYQDYSRLTAMTKVDVTPTKWLKLGTNLRVGYIDIETPWGSGPYATNPWFINKIMLPIFPIYAHDMSTGKVLYDDNGNKRYDDGIAIYNNNGDLIKPERQNFLYLNPAQSGSLDKKGNTNIQLNASVYATITFLKDFKFTVDANTNIDAYNSSSMMNSVAGDQATAGGLIQKDNQQSQTYTFKQVLEWSRSFGKHNIDLLVAHENFQYNQKFMTIAKTGEIANGIPELDNYVKYYGVGGNSSQYRSEGYFGRMSYGFDEKYYFQASFRRDGSSKFHESNRWGNFWSVGASWILSSENFMANATWLNFMKIRASYGTTGNDGGFGKFISWYSGYQRYQISSFDDSPAMSLSDYGSPNLRWEAASTLDFAVEFSMFNRFNGSIGYYEKANDDLIFRVPLPIESGIGSQFQNVGRMVNRGVEISLDVDAVRTRDWLWNIGLNVTWQQNRITKLPAGNDDGIRNGMQILKEGHSIYEFYLAETQGVDSADGGMWFTLDEDLADYDDTEGSSHKTLDDGTRVTKNSSEALNVLAGDALSPIMGSINSSLTWRNLTLNVIFVYRIGGVAMDNTYNGLMNGGWNSPMHVNMKDSWRFPGDDAKLPRMAQMTDPGTLHSYDSALLSNSYIALQNVTLTYTFPEKIANKLTLKGLSVYASGENLFQVSALKGYDAQSSFNGTIDRENYFGSFATVSFGINIAF